MTNYVYVYLDPLKSGKYTYGHEEYVFDHEPFYVGRGQKDRYKFHLYRARGKRDDYHPGTNRHMIRKVRMLMKDNREPYVVFLQENISYEESLEKEKYLIQLIRRRDHKKGPLLNLTGGGEGCNGYYPSDEVRQKISQSVKNSLIHSTRGRHRTEEEKRKTGDPQRGIPKSKEQRTANSRLWHDPKYRLWRIRKRICKSLFHLVAHKKPFTHSNYSWYKIRQAPRFEHLSFYYSQEELQHIIYQLQHGVDLASLCEY